MLLFPRLNGFLGVFKRVTKIIIYLTFLEKIILLMISKEVRLNSIYAEKSSKERIASNIREKLLIIVQLLNVLT